MARSRRSSPFLACALAACSALTLAQEVSAARGASGENKCTDPIEVNADSADVDYKNNTTQWVNVVISQCDIRVQAKRASATGVNSDYTRWTFDGDVRIDVEKRGSLRSKQAVVDVQDNQIAKATITGTPAEFEQRNAETNVTTRGHAGEIVYEVGPGTVRLTDDAWLSSGTTDMKGSSFLYNIRDEKVQAASQPGGKERVHIRITPKQKPAGEAQKNDSGVQGTDGGNATGARPAPRTP
jgi:lipopolysaccharide transport protein LptA